MPWKKKGTSEGPRLDYALHIFLGYFIFGEGTMDLIRGYLVQA